MVTSRQDTLKNYASAINVLEQKPYIKSMIKNSLNFIILEHPFYILLFTLVKFAFVISTGLSLFALSKKVPDIKFFAAGIVNFFEVVIDAFVALWIIGFLQNQSWDLRKVISQKFFAIALLIGYAFPLLITIAASEITAKFPLVGSPAQSLCYIAIWLAALAISLFVFFRFAFLLPATAKKLPWKANEVLSRTSFAQLSFFCFCVSVFLIFYSPVWIGVMIFDPHESLRSKPNSIGFLIEYFIGALVSVMVLASACFASMQYLDWIERIESNFPSAAKMETLA